VFDELYRYFDLTNEQVSLRQRNRISEAVWREWCCGIQANLKYPCFQKAWEQIKTRSSSFHELRRLEKCNFECDPAKWKMDKPNCSEPSHAYREASAKRLRTAKTC
jgi:hypothetical protein